MARMLLGDYCAYQIYAWSSDSGSLSKPETISTFRVKPVDEFGINSSTELLIREQVGYAGPGSRAYACFDNDRIIGVCFYWFGKRYLKRNFWPLQNDEAKLVQIISVPEMRGRGAASLLIAESCRDMNKEPRPKGRGIGIPETMGRGTPQAAGNLPAMIQKGFSQTYARIWHSNTPSIKAFERAGWTRIAFVLEINPLRKTRPIRIRFNLKSRALAI